MGQVVAYVAKDPSTKYSYCSVPIVEEHGMCELVERCGKSDEKGRGHNEAVFVHWEVVVDSVEEEMGCDTNAVVREVSMRR